LRYIALAVVAIAFPLAGCLTAAEQVAEDASACQGYRVAGNAQGYAQCRYQLSAMRQQAKIDAGNAFADGLQNAADNYALRAATPVQPQPMISQCAAGYSCRDYSQY
jgi:hypothetical protein